MNEKQNLENNKDLQIKDSDIAIVEALHDLLLDKHNYVLSFYRLQEARKLTQKMHKIISYQEKFIKNQNQPNQTSKNILLEANDIIFNRAEEKQRQYGNIDDSLFDASEIASIIENKTFTINDVYAVLIGLKISRMKHNKKHDTFLDGIGYLAAYENYIRKSEIKNKDNE